MEEVVGNLFLFVSILGLSQSRSGFYFKFCKIILKKIYDIIS